jgi:FixJ family two-component response regulator
LRWIKVRPGVFLQMGAMPINSPPCVLVVDDDAALLSSLEFALRAEGYRVRGCADSESALNGATEAPACMVIDYKLPDMDGTELANCLRRKGMDAPLILITTNPDARCRAKAAKCGAVIVEKPLLGDKLIRQIRSLTAPVAD